MSSFPMPATPVVRHRTRRPSPPRRRAVLAAAVLSLTFALALGATAVAAAPARRVATAHAQRVAPSPHPTTAPGAVLGIATRPTSRILAPVAVLPAGARSATAAAAPPPVALLVVAIAALLAATALAVRRFA